MEEQNNNMENMEEQNNNMQEDEKSGGFGYMGLLLGLCLFEGKISPWLGIIACIVATYYLFSSRYYVITRIVAFLVIAGHIFLYLIFPQMGNNYYDGSISIWGPHQEQKAIMEKVMEEGTEVGTETGTEVGMPEEDTDMKTIYLRPKYNATIKKWGYVDVTGKEIRPFIYEEAFDFSEGLARVKVNGKYGFIDKEGKQIISCKYKDASDFSEGFAVVKLKDKKGYVNRNGFFSPKD
jgi:hypothetical protein